MRVLVATCEPQGSGDHAHAVAGELVTPIVLECPDRHCDVCARAWVGLASHAHTTTAMVVEHPHLTVADLRRAIHEFLDRRGTVDLIVQAAEAGEYEVDGVVFDDPVMAVDELIDAHLAEIAAIGDAFGEGAVVSRLGQLVCERVVPFAA